MILYSLVQQSVTGETARKRRIAPGHKNKSGNIWQNKTIHRRTKIRLIEDVLFSYFRTTAKSGLSRPKRKKHFDIFEIRFCAECF